MQTARVTNSRCTWLCGLFCGVWVAGLGGVAMAETEATPTKADAGPTLNDLLQRIDSLERRNKSLEGQVSELKAIEGEKWLSQERADQIRSVVADVIADADSRASLRQDAMTAGWNDGFFLASPDGRFKLQVNGLIQPRFMWSHTSGTPNTSYTVPDQLENRYGFDSNYNELTFKGHIFSPAVEYMVKTNVAMGDTYQLGTQPNAVTNNLNAGPTTGQMYLLDAWARISFTDEISLRVGQYRSPYAREQLVTEQNQMAVSRTGVVRNYGLWYTQGIELQSQGDDFRTNISLDNGGSSNVAGTATNIIGQQPLNAPWYTQQVSYSVTTRIEWKPYGAWKDFTSFTSPMGDEQGMLFGFAYHRQQSSPNQNFNTGDTLPANNWDAWTLDWQWNMGGASLFASAFYNYVTTQNAFAYTISPPNNVTPIGTFGSVNAYGVVIQPAIYFLPKWEWYTRYEYGYIDLGDGNTDPAYSNQFAQQPYNVITTGVNWYIDGQDLKWTMDMGFSMSDVDYSWQNLPAGWRISGSNQFVVRTQLQLMF